LTNEEKAMKNRYRLFIVFSKNWASQCQLFSLIFIPSGSEREDFLKQTGWFYSYQCSEPIFISISDDSQGSCYTQKVLQFQRKFIKDDAYRMKVSTEVYFLNLDECAVQFWPFIWHAIFQKQLNTFANWCCAELRFAHPEKQYL